MGEEAKGKIMEQAIKRDDLPGKGIGLVIFAVGITLMVLVFVWAYHLFSGWAQHTSFGNGSIVQELVRCGVRLGLLFVMAYISSLITSKGLQLYGVCRGVPPR